MSYTFFLFFSANMLVKLPLQADLKVDYIDQKP